MNYNIKVQPAGLSFNADADASILDSALSANIHLEHSCKTGDCGVCTAELHAGLVVDSFGNSYTSDRILTCSTKPRSDLELVAEVYPELAAIQQKVIPAKVDQILFAVKDVVVITLRLPPNANFHYLPGQYIDMTYQGVKRSYSIANAQVVSTGIELHIRRVPNGRLSELLFTEIKKESLLRIEGPKGTFFVRDTGRPIIFLAGGTGFAPIKAMIEKLVADQCRRRFHIYWGMPSASMFYHDIARQWAESHASISYIPVVSEPGENWQGRTGLVHKAVLEDFSDLSDFDVNACGSPLMIEAAKKDFLLNGLDARNFYSDAFTPAK